MKPKFEVELKCLEEEGILSKVKFSNWATPIVPIVKPNGTVRICDVYKITANLQMQSEYPLPRFDDIFSKLEGGRSLPKSTLDRHTIRWRKSMSHKST